MMRLKIAIQRMESGSDERSMISQLMDQLKHSESKLTDFRHKADRLEDTNQRLEMAVVMVNVDAKVS